MSGAPSAEIFKAYDIRGLYPEQIDGQIAERIGRAFARVLSELEGKPVAELRIGLGRDMRLSAPELSARYREGMLAAGADVIDAGLVGSEMLYYLVGSRELLGERLSPGLRLVELALQFTAGLVKAEQFVHVQVDALNPDGRLHGLRVVPDESSVQHGGNATRSGASRAYADGDPRTVEGMLVTNHVLSGVVIGAAVRRPAAA